VGTAADVNAAQGNLNKSMTTVLTSSVMFDYTNCLYCLRNGI
jgi:hypothetical protein